MSNLEKFDFSFNLSGLQSYTEQRTNALISETILTGDFAQQVQIVPNVKGVQDLNVLSTNMTPQAGGCGWNPATGNTTTFTQKAITSVKQQYQESLCVDDLEGFWYQTLLKPGQYYNSPSDIPFEEYLVNYKVEKAKEMVELQLFSATTGTTGFAGFKALTSSAYSGDNVTVVTGATGTSVSNIGDSIDTMLSQAQDYLAAAKDGAIFMSWSNFRNYTVWVRNKNFFYLQSPGDGQAKILHPGSNFEVIPVHGLTGSNRIFITKKANLFIGTDLVSDYSQFKIWYSMDNQVVRMKMQYRLGAATGVDQILSNNLA